MASTDTVLQIKKVQSTSFDVSTPEARARLLVALKSHAGEFTDAEHRSYDAFRDALLRLARGEGSPDSLDNYKETLGHFLQISSGGVEAPKVATEPVVEKKEVVPQVVVEKKNEASTENVVPAAAPMPFRGRRGPDVVAPEAETTPTTPASVELPKEGVKTPAKEEIVVQDSVVKEVQVAEMSQPSQVKEEQKNDARSLRGRIEKINDGLNEFAHGAAFKWLSDASTGYRSYLNELLELRGLLGEAGELSANDAVAISARIDALREMADAVRRKVGGEEITPSNPVVENAPVAPEAAVSAAASPSVAEEKKDEEVVPWGTPEANVVAQSVTQASEDAPKQSIASEMPAQPLSPGISDSDTLNTPVIDSGLNDLLTRWLGTTGFLGFGDGGVKHPDWAKMKDLFVEDVLHGDGVVPPGLKPELFENLGKNIIGWRDAYALYPLDSENVEHYIRRVVEMSVSK